MDNSLKSITRGIPKVVFQTDKTKEIREIWKEGPPSLQNVALPGWKYEFYDDEDIEKYVVTHFEWFYSTWKKYPHNIMRVDTFRYMKLYRDGGFYSDMDYKYLKNIEYLFYNTDGAPTEPLIHIIKSANFKSSWSNSIMASVPGHPFWLDVLKQCQIRPFSAYFGKMSMVLNWTGPRMITRVIKRGLTITNGTGIIKSVPIPGLVALPKELNMGDISEYNIIKKDALAVALEGQSWAGMGEKILNTLCIFFKKLWALLVIIVILIIVIGVILVLRHYQNKHRCVNGESSSTNMCKQQRSRSIRW
jgi:mannosyltransferase OCH1-like enzyme